MIDSKADDIQMDFTYVPTNENIMLRVTSDLFPDGTDRPHKAC